LVIMTTWYHLTTPSESPEDYKTTLE